MPTKTDLILDTHIWVWLVTGDFKLQDHPLIPVLEKSSANLLISAISLWEISMLVSKGRLKLQRKTKDWLNENLIRSKTEVIPITVEIACQSNELDGFHGDPADRIILATSIQKKGQIVPLDHSILKYCQANQIDCL